jgi:hypothetical protein
MPGLFLCPHPLHFLPFSQKQKAASIFIETAHE